MEQIGLFAFIVFAVLTFLLPFSRKAALSRSFTGWMVDLVSLGIHFFILPVLQIYIVFSLLNMCLYEIKGSFSVGIGDSFFLYLILDYGWYWNHRFFHAETPFWYLHSTHHRPAKLDFFITARNSLVSHFFMVYFWGIGLIVFLLKDASFFLGFVTFGMLINFWGHTSFSFKLNGYADRLLSYIFIMPRDHHWHHSREVSNCNFGTVFSIWDRLHNSLYRPGKLPDRYGEDSKETVWNQLIWPFQNK
ncbi:MAG: sterol desaturase family protein [Bdellovibrionales bacterium]